MSFIEGVTLLEHLKNSGGKIPVEPAVQIIMPVLDALKEVHRAGIMHRDISPDNIFIDREGRVVLIDFGAARQEIREKSKSLSVILKAGYAPEEQYRSKGKQGPWTDIYAVGATLYRSITGNTPPEAMDRLAEDDLVIPSELDVEIDPNLEKVLLKALAVKVVERFQAVEEFQKALLSLQSNALKEEFTANQTQPVKQPPLKKLKKCLYCGEDINADAVLCIYCSMHLDEVKPEVVVPTSGNFINTALMAGFPFGVIMGIFYSWNLGRLAIGIPLGIGVGVLFGLLFALFVRWFVQRTTSRFQADRPDFGSESVLIEGPANHGAVGGYLWITDRRVHFASHSLNIQNHDWTVLLSEIRNIQAVKTFGFIDKGISIRTNNAEKHRFAVINSRRWAEVIHHLISA
jgi:hypothetical protein